MSWIIHRGCEKILCTGTCIVFGCIFYVAFLLETASTKWSASLNAFHICIRKGTFRNMLNQIHVNLLKNKFPHNIIHTQCNINMQWSERLHLMSIDVVHGYIELYHDKDSDLYIPIEDNWNFCKKLKVAEDIVLGTFSLKLMDNHFIWKWR